MELAVWTALVGAVSLVLLNFSFAAVSGMAALRSISFIQMQSVQALRSIYIDARSAYGCTTATVSGVNCASASNLCLTVPGMARGWPYPKAFDYIIYTRDATGLRRRVVHADATTTGHNGVGISCDRQTSDLYVAAKISSITFDRSVGSRLGVTLTSDYDEQRPTATGRFTFPTVSMTAHYREITPSNVYE